MGFGPGAWFRGFAFGGEKLPSIATLMGDYIVPAALIIPLIRGFMNHMEQTSPTALMWVEGEGQQSSLS